MRRVARFIFGIGLFIVTATTSASAQPWDVYEDPISGEICDLVNADNTELVVFTDTGELVIVSGTDVFLGESFVDNDGNVFFDGFPFGVIAFATDGDGLRSLWWLTDNGTVVAIDFNTFSPFDSLTFPDEYVGVPCDACPFWDDPFDCEDIVLDSDGDGVTDDFDECPGTGPGEIIDTSGCSCEDLDDCDCFFDTDRDGVADCDDLCPNSPQNANVDIDGCTVVVVSPPPISIACGSFSALMLGLTFTGLFMMRSAGRNR